MARSETNQMRKYNQTMPSFGSGKSTDERDRLIREYAPLVKTIAGRLANKLPQHINTNDLLSAGIMGLLDAIDKFDEDKGTEFKSYAEFRIRGAMIDELRAMDWFPRSVRRNAKRLEEAYLSVENKKMRPARDEEVAEELKVDIQTFYKFIEEARGISIVNEYELMNNVSSMDSGIMAGLDTSVSGNNPLDYLNSKEIKRVIGDAVDSLPKTEKTVMALYYYEELTMKEIGSIMGYTESRISQLHTKAVIRLRTRLRKYFE